MLLLIPGWRKLMTVTFPEGLTLYSPGWSPLMSELTHQNDWLLPSVQTICFDGKKSRSSL